LKYSVVSGVLSARREIEGRQMLQLAIPVEPGNSGSPVLDMEGRVQGIVTMKSAVSDNLGFADDVADLKPLLEKPNPVPIARWLAIGALDERQWKALFGANWKQRAGRISVEGAGDGFGGRSLCIFQQETPEVPFDVAVRMKLDDEAGAAGLIFHADGEDRHYGFYPSNGNLRVTSFQGPTVFSWQVLSDRPSEHYRRGDWNLLRVHVEKDRFVCFVNEHEVFSSTDASLQSGKVGLAKFRDTKAEFREFQLAPNIEGQAEPEQQRDEVARLIGELSSNPSSNTNAESLAALAALAPLSERALRDEAKKLEQNAASLRRLADDVHVESVIAELKKCTSEEKLDLLRACLLVSRLDDQDVEIDAYVKEVDRMAEEIRKNVADSASDNDRLQALDKYLFQDNGFHGSRHEYYHRANSYLNRVVDDREGLPITLSILYMELGRRLGLTIEGVGLPGHFVVRYVPVTGESEMIDVFDGGKRLSRDDVETIVRNVAQQPLDEQHLKSATAHEILVRVLQNLLNVAQQQEDAQALRRYLEALVTLEPESMQLRGMRALARYQSGRPTAAIEDLDWFLEHQPAGVDLDRIREMRSVFEGSK
jgi:regulator of sirC expression with transglutaminase-like and TPR domain